MNRTKIVSALVCALLSFSAQAITVTLDDFEVAQTPVFGLPITTGPALNNAGTLWSSRTLAITSATGTPNMGAYIEVINGQLQIGNGPQIFSTASVNWNLNLASLNPYLTNATFFEISIDQLMIDVGTVDTVGIGSGVRTTRGASNVRTSVALFSGAVGSFPNPFNVTFQSTTSTDSIWDNLKITVSCRIGATSIVDADRTEARCNSAQVPLPGTALLLSLGLLGFAGLRRKA
jgi:PEP-CTERM motif